jgi:uncharacterized membrane protein
MATLTVWKFDSPDGAGDASATLKRLQKQQLLQVQDAAVISWPADARKPTIALLHDLASDGSVGGAFWGLLFGLLFFVPPLGMAIATGFGELIASTPDLGIDEKVIKQLRDKITRNSSALLLMSASAVTDQVLDEMKAQAGNVEVIESNLTRAQEAKLRGIFAQQPPTTASQVEPASLDPRTRTAA